MQHLLHSHGKISMMWETFCRTKLSRLSQIKGECRRHRSTAANTNCKWAPFHMRLMSLHLQYLTNAFTQLGCHRQFGTGVFIWDQGLVGPNLRLKLFLQNQAPDVSLQAYPVSHQIAVIECKQ